MNNIIGSMLQAQNTFREIYNISTDSTLFLDASERTFFESMVQYYEKTDRVPSLYDADYATFARLEFQITLDKINKYTGNVSIGYAIIEFKQLIESKLELNIKNRFNNINVKGFDFAEEAQKIIAEESERTENQISKREQSNKESVEKTFDVIYKSMKGEKTNFLSTGIENLDKVIVGFPVGKLTVVAARPAMGKTAFMLQCIRNLIHEEVLTGLISLEMTDHELNVRNLSAHSTVNSRDIDSGQLQPEELAILESERITIEQDNYFLNYNPIQTINSIKAIIRSWAKKGTKAVFIDYLQLIRTNGKKDLRLEIGEITFELTVLAKQLDVAIILLSQLNRNVESRNDKRPMMSDLKESGNIEQDANTIIFLNRPMVYGINPMDKMDEDLFCRDQSVLKPEEYYEIIVSKSRGSDIGLVRSRWIREYHRIEGIIITKRSSNNGID